MEAELTAAASAVRDTFFKIYTPAFAEKLKRDGLSEDSSEVHNPADGSTTLEPTPFLLQAIKRWKKVAREPAFQEQLTELQDAFKQNCETNILAKARSDLTKRIEANQVLFAFFFVRALAEFTQTALIRSGIFVCDVVKIGYGRILKHLLGGPPLLGKEYSQGSEICLEQSMPKM